MNTHNTRQQLQNPYAYINDIGGFDHSEYSKPYLVKNFDNPWRNEDQILFDSVKKQPQYSSREIESLARQIHLELWTNRKVIFHKNTDELTPLDLLDTEVVIRNMGYSVETLATLGNFNFEEGFHEVAGVINMHEGKVQISRMFKPDVQRFTLAHELGHALLHEHMVYHRDRPLSCPGKREERPVKEWEADKFASFFLMPARQVRQEFTKRFGNNPVSADQDTAFGLFAESVPAFAKRLRNNRDFSRIIARANSFHGIEFPQLSKVFGVSVEAMAIRLEELDLVKFLDKT